MKSWGIGTGSRVMRVPKSKLKEQSHDKTLDGTDLYSFGNVMWMILFGWWLAGLFMFSALLLYATYICRNYGRFCFEIGRYLFFPFGKFVVEESDDDHHDRSEAGSLLPRIKQKVDVAYIVWLIFFAFLIAPVLLFGACATWFFVVSAPMAKVHWRLFQIGFAKPLHISVIQGYGQVNSASVLLNVYRAFSRKYLSYTLFGVNIFFVNCLPLVFIRTATLLFGLFTQHELLPPLVSFFFDIFCTIPITFYIGLSIECITQQTNYMVGALLNASFGSLTELILFSLALNKGHLGELIIYSLTGGLLNDMLLIPGLSMIAGGLKYKEQRFNPSGTGVGSLLFFMAIVGAFSPSIFYKAFGGYHEVCVNCSWTNETTKEWECLQCYQVQEPDTDPIFVDGVKYIMYITTAVLPCAYFIGLLFTFKTHSHLFQEEEGEGDDAPPWSILTSSFVMFFSVLMFGLIAEDVVNIVEAVLKALSVKQSFLGVTLIALTPAFTEIANAVRFALDNQIGLSVQIGAASAVQVALIQMPCLTVLALIFGKPDDNFHLIFPNLSIFAVTLAVFTFNYISTDGSANYFIGAVLVMMYFIILSAFYFVPEVL